MLVESLDVLTEAVDQFLFAGNSNAPQQVPGEFAEEDFHQIEPGTMFGGKDKLKPLRSGGQIALGFLGDMG